MTLHHPLPVRRRLLLGALGLPFLLHDLKALAAPAITQLNVLTSYPDEVMSRFEAAFEKAHPQYRIRFLWRMPNDALPYLQKQAAPGEADVYWSASPRTFSLLKERKLLSWLEVERGGLPDTIGRTRISDPDGYFLATEVAGYVFALNESRLSRLGVPIPLDWPDLANPRLAGNIALPVPSEVGFAPVLFDIVLQAFGWEKGWALWSEIAGLSILSRRGSTFITDLVGNSQAAIGLSIDFFVKAAIANGAAISQRYPLHNGINPGQIAIPASAANREGALAFVRFVLSPEGQKLLMHPDIRKLPVRPDVYAEQDPSQFNPFISAEKGGLGYDGEKGRWRLSIISAVFDQMLANPHSEIVALWKRVHQLEASGRSAAAVRAILGKPPITEEQAQSNALRSLFRNELEGAILQRREVMQAWEVACRQSRNEAHRLLEGMVA